MTRRRETISADYFDALYRDSPDPWNFETSDYEHKKYASTLAALPRDRYDRAFEVGCSIGVLTRQLAGRCDTLIACDASAAPLQRARTNCEGLTNIIFERLTIPADWPGGSFDLIVFSEVLYYLAPADLALCGERVAACLPVGGDVVMVHYTGETDYPLSGDDAVRLFGHSLSAFADEVRTERSERYRLDVWRKSA